MGGRFSNDQEFAAFNVRMLERVRAVPGVEAAGTSHFLPLGASFRELVSGAPIGLVRPTAKRR